MTEPVAANKKEIIQRILQEIEVMNYCGAKKELVERLTKSSFSGAIIDNAYKELCLVGIIKQGYDGLGNLRFRLTSFGEKHRNFFSSCDEIRQGLRGIKSRMQITP